MWRKTAIGVAALLIALCTPLPSQSGGPTWERNSFPGPGHVANPGPWGPGEGSDRTEKVNAFGISPVNPDFMLMGTDIGRLVYTNDGHNFVAAELPSRRVLSLSFDPVDPACAYAWVGGVRQASSNSGWWRTRDKGRTWSLIMPASSNRVPDSPWGKCLLAVDPARRGHLYVATYGDGLWRTTDDGRTWSCVAFPGRVIHSLTMAGDGSRLYVLVSESQPKAADRAFKANAKDLLGELWVLEDGKASTLRRLELNRVSDLELDPRDPTRGFLILNAKKLVPFRDQTRTLLPQLDTSVIPGQLRMVLTNPANPRFLVLLSDHCRVEDLFHYSSDGGNTWQGWSRDGNWLTAIQDYAPFNWKSEDYHYPLDEGQVRAPAARTVDFLPGNPKSVLMWGLTPNQKGPLRSDDYGASFVPFGHGGNFKRANSMAIGDSDSVLGVARMEYGIVLTRDGGLSWRSYNYVNTTPWASSRREKRGYQSRAGWGVAFQPGNDRVVLVSVGSKPVSLLRSEDFGEHWSQVGSDQAVAPSPIFWHRQNREVVYAGGRRSEDGGRTWPASTGSVVLDMSSANGDLVVAALPGPDYKLAVSADRGNHWTPLTDLPVRIAVETQGAVAIDPRPEHDPTRPNGKWRILLAGRAGVYVYQASDQSGSKGVWRLSSGGMSDSPGLGGVWLSRVAFDPRRPQIVYAAAGAAQLDAKRDEQVPALNGALAFRQLYRSLDAGETWTRIAGQGFPGLPSYADALNIAVSPSTGRFYLQEWTGQYSLPAPYGEAQ